MQVAHAIAVWWRKKKKSAVAMINKTWGFPEMSYIVLDHQAVKCDLEHVEPVFSINITNLTMLKI